MKPLSKALLFGGAILLVAVSGAIMTGLNLGGPLSPKDRALAPLPVVTPFLRPAAESPEGTMFPTETTSGSTGTLDPYSSNADPVPPQGYAPEYIAPGTRFVVGTEPDPGSTEPATDTAATGATPDLPVAIPSQVPDPAPSASGAGSSATVATGATIDAVGSATNAPAPTAVTTRDPAASPPTAPATGPPATKTHGTPSLPPPRPGPPSGRRPSHRTSPRA
jgi:hypothetical protein